MTRALLSLIVMMSAGTVGTAAAQAVYPGQPSIGDPIADQHRRHMEIQRQRSDAIADFSRQYRIEARLTELELGGQRLAEPYIPLVAIAPRDAEGERQARERATAARQATVAGVTQIDDWLARGPR